MEQEMIGAFLQKSRREKGMTQKELADTLHISDKTISKWETGKSMPDVVYMENICEALGITINELLSGQKILPEEYPKKADDNMLSLLQENCETKKQNRKSIIVGGILLILSLVSLFSMMDAAFNWYLDLPSLLIFVSINVALGLLTCRRKQREVIPFLRKTVLPVGISESLISAVCIVGNVSDVSVMAANFAVGLLPVIYALITYLVLLVMEQSMC